MGAYEGAFARMEWPATVYFEADDAGGSEPVCEQMGVVADKGDLESLARFTAEAAFKAGLYLERPGDWAHVLLIPGTGDDLDDGDIERAVVLWSEYNDQ